MCPLENWDDPSAVKTTGQAVGLGGSGLGGGGGGGSGRGRGGGLGGFGTRAIDQLSICIKTIRYAPYTQKCECGRKPPGLCCGVSGRARWPPWCLAEVTGRPPERLSQH
jgi:hypothetical protein